MTLLESATLEVLKKIGLDSATRRVTDAFVSVVGLDFASTLARHAANHFQAPLLQPLVREWVTSDEFLALAARAAAGTLDEATVHASLDVRLGHTLFSDPAIRDEPISGEAVAKVVFTEWQRLIFADDAATAAHDALEQARYESLLRHLTAGTAAEQERQLHESLSTLQEYIANAGESWRRAPYRIVEVLFGGTATTVPSAYVPPRLALAGSGARTPMQAVDVPSLLASSDRLLIAGTAGAGKSTLLRMIALHAWEQPETLGLQRHVPLLLSARHLFETAGEGPASDDEWLLAAMLKSASYFASGGRPPLRRWSVDTGAPWMLLVDGLELVDEGSRGAFLERLSSLADRLTPRTKLLVTARPEALESLAPTTRFTAAAIVPFGVDQLELLGTRLLGTDAAAFFDALGSRRLEAVGWGPLLFTIVAGLFRRGVQVERLTRGRIYAECIAWIDTEHRVALAAALDPRIGADREQLMDETAIASVLPFGPSELLAGAIGADLRRRYGFDAADAQALAWNWLLAAGAHSGYLEVTRDAFEWLHPLLHDAASARAIVRRQSAESFLRAQVARWHDVWWRDLLLFTFDRWLETADAVAVLAFCDELRQTQPGVLLLASAIADGVELPVAVEASLVDAFAAEVRAMTLMEGFVAMVSPPACSSALQRLAERHGDRVRAALRAILVDASVDPAVRGHAGELLIDCGGADDLDDVTRTPGVEGYVRVSAAASLACAGRIPRAAELLARLASDGSLYPWERESALHAIDMLDSDRDFYRLRYAAGDGHAQVLVGELEMLRSLMTVLWPEVVLALRDWDALVAAAALPDAEPATRMRLAALRDHIASALWKYVAFNSGGPEPSLEGLGDSEIGHRFIAQLHAVTRIDVYDDVPAEEVFRRLYGHVLEVSAKDALGSMGLRCEALRLMRTLVGETAVERVLAELPSDDLLLAFLTKHGRSRLLSAGGNRRLMPATVVATMAMNVYLARAGLRYARGDAGGALEDYTRVIEESGDDELRIEARLERAHLLFQRDRAAARADYAILRDTRRLDEEQRARIRLPLATIAIEDRDWSALRDLAREALESGLETSAAALWYRYLASASQRLGDSTAAIEAYTRCLQLVDEATAVELHFQRGCLLAGVDDDAALADFTAVLESPADERHAEAAAWRAEIHQRRGEFEAALDDYTAALAKYERGTESWMRLSLERAQLLVELDRKEAARELFESLLPLTRSDEEARGIKLAIAALTSATAFVDGREAGNEPPAGDFAGTLLYARQMADGGQLEAAIDVLTRFLDGGHGGGEERCQVLMFRGDFHAKAGRDREAWDDFEAAAEAATTMEDRLKAAARAASITTADEVNRLIALFRPVIAAEQPELRAASRLIIARLRAEAGQYALAVDEAGQLLDDDPIDGDARVQAFLYRGYWNVRLERYRDAVADFERAWSHPAATGAVVYDARIESGETKRLRLDEDPLPDYHEAVRVPGITPLQRAKAYTAIALTHWRSNDLTAVVAALRKAVREYSGDGYLRRLLSRALAELGDLDQAMDELRRGIAQTTDQGLAALRAELETTDTSSRAATQELDLVRAEIARRENRPLSGG